MTTVPVDILKAIAALPEGDAAQLMLRTDGKGNWTIETTLYDRATRHGPMWNVQELLERRAGQLTK